jgi:hypothetical protein
MIEIPLVHDRGIMTVDDSDLDLIAPYRWYLFRAIYTDYVVGGLPGSRDRVFVHRVILSVPSGTEVDHRNGNGLDNQRSNLRICTEFQNNHNQRPRVGCTSRFKGVYWDRHHAKWQARIMSYGARHHLGYFDDETEAAMAYDQAAQTLHGEFAFLNRGAR